MGFICSGKYTDKQLLMLTVTVFLSCTMPGNAATHLFLSSSQIFHLGSDKSRGIGRIWICSVAYNFYDAKEALLYEQTLLFKTTGFYLCSCWRPSAEHLEEWHSF